ncbi:hypothetical protein [Prevotella dentasini]|uniref:hypothetical protein n=1 Tax=Prevotella dentasini TaxID=589537 RepID=UPI00046943A8|nr:hypothetical protein [Prevotella dentasini]
MKKTILLFMASFFATVVFGQTGSNEILKFITKEKTSKAVILDQVKDLKFTSFKMEEFTFDITEVQTDKILIDVAQPENCVKYYILISPEELTGTEGEIRKKIIEQYNIVQTAPYYAWIQGLTEATTYYFYVLGVDSDGIPCAMTKKEAKTLAKATDEFKIEISNVASADGSLVVTPKDASMTYYPFIVTKEDYNTMIQRYTNVQKADTEYWTYLAEQMGVELKELLPNLLRTGKLETTLKELKGADLTPETEYVVYCYGVTPEGTFTTEPYMEEFKTTAAEVSNNNIQVTIDNVYHDGVDVTVKTTTADKYVLNIQSKRVWERELQNAEDDKVKAATSIVSTLSFYGGLESSIFSGDFKGKVPTGQSDTDCVLLVFGYDGGITTDIQAIEFHTNPE